VRRLGGPPLGPVGRPLAAVFGVLALMALLAIRLAAHDIPADTTVRAFIKPDGQLLHFLVRVPMASINDIDWPLRRTDGTLDMPRIEPFLRDAATMWIADYVDMFEGGTKLGKPTLVAVRLSNEGDPSFGFYDDAHANIHGERLPDDSTMVPTQGMLDVQFDYAIQSDRSRFSFHPRFDRFGLRVVTVLHFLPPGAPSGSPTAAATPPSGAASPAQTQDGPTERVFEYVGGDPGTIRLDPSWWQSAASFVRIGVQHVLDGSDHLLFLFCLVIPLRRMRSLVPVVTAFVVAHSITLIASAYDMAPGASWFPPLVDTLIAVSIVYMAAENILVAEPRRRWQLAFVFGLIHGFGFALAFKQTLQFAGAHFLSALLAFNVGLELGQIAMLLLFVPALALLFRFVLPERMGVIVLSAIGAHTAWHWMLDRFALLSRYRFELPVIDAAFLANLLRWLMVIVALAFAAWVLNLFRDRSSAEHSQLGIKN
jgi:hypothetical protein